MEKSEFQKKIPIKILISGSCRSGTRYLASVLQRCGIQVVHEGLGPDGAVSCYYAVEDYWYQGFHWARLSQLEPEHRWHQTRHPLKVIGSMIVQMPGGFWHWQEKHSGVSGELPGLIRTMLYWLKWNEIVERQEYDLRFQIEKLPERWHELSGILGIVREMPELPHLSSGGKKAPVTWQMLEDADVILARDVRQKAKEYGYED
jgi:hypothetical protein